MPNRLPRLTGKEVVRTLRRGGWDIVRQEGSHVQLAHPDRPGVVTVPVHAGEIIAPRLLMSVLRQAGLTATDFEELLRG